MNTMVDGGGSNSTIVNEEGYLSTMATMAN
jgi:hypothetical protein